MAVKIGPQKQVFHSSAQRMINNNQKTLLALLLLVFFLISLYFSDALSLDNFKAHKVVLKQFITDHYWLAVVMFFISCVVFINSPLPLAAVIKVLGGFFFGVTLGAIFNILATILACLIGFGISRYAFKDWFEKAYYQRLKAVETDIETNGFYYFLTLRLVMVVPYFLINITAGISRISFKKFLFSTTLGVMPASLIYANGGNKLEQINDLSELFKADTVIALLLVAVFVLLPVIVKKYFAVSE